MDLRFTEEQDMLRKTARDFLTTECPKAKVRELEKDEKGYSPAIWDMMAKLGWMGLIIPEEYEGAGMTFQDLTVLLEEMGRNILPGPFLSTMVSAYPIIEVGTKEQKNGFLRKIANGELISAFAILEASGTFDPSTVTTRAMPKGDDFVINGTKLFVDMAHVADYFICITRTSEGVSPEDGITLFLLDARSPGICREVIPTIGINKLYETSFKDVIVPGENLLGELDKGWPVLMKTLEMGAIAKCAESIGGMQSCVELTVGYSKNRVQYDRPIAAFQAPQHMMVDMWIATETSRYLVYEAAWMKSTGRPCAKEVSMARAYTNESYKYVSKWAVRLHGAVGTTRDHDIQLYYRMAKAADTVFGNTDFHRELVAQEIGLV